MSEVMMEVRNLKKHFDVSGGVLSAVDGVSFDINKGETLGVVGESGCGKSTLGRTLIHLETPTAGQIIFKGQDVTRLKGHALKKYREHVQMIFQDPYSSINPRMTIEQTIKEPLQLSGRYSKADIDTAVEKLMATTGVENRLRYSYPHELDGGRRQRACIARALALNPDFIVCDEPVSALDVSIQAQILNLLMDIQEETGLTLMFITHDLSVVRHISHKIAVMYLGQLVETGASEEIFRNPAHPYTKALLSAVPSTDIHNPSHRVILQGELSSPINPRPGCRFRSRCPFATEDCKAPQSLKEIEQGHFVSCCRINEIG